MNISTQLLNDCRKGDRKAQYQLYRTCYNILMGVCLRYKQDEDTAAAIMNQGFLKVLNNLDKYRSEVPFDAWIKRIMINTIIDEFRKNRKVRELMEYTDFSEENFNAHPLDYNMAAQQMDADQLESMIRMLPPVSQKVFNLVAIDGYSHHEVSELLGISAGTSKWHVSFARKKLQELVSQVLNTSKIV